MLPLPAFIVWSRLSSTRVIKAETVPRGTHSHTHTRLGSGDMQIPAAARTEPVLLIPSPIPFMSATRIALTSTKRCGSQEEGARCVCAGEQEDDKEEGVRERIRSRIHLQKGS